MTTAEFASQQAVMIDKLDHIDEFTRNFSRQLLDLLDQKSVSGRREVMEMIHTMWNSQWKPSVTAAGKGRVAQ